MSFTDDNTISSLSFADLIAELEAFWRPDLGVLALPKSATADTLAPMPTASVQCTAVQAIPNNAVTGIVWDTFPTPSGGMATTGFGIQVPRAGYYLAVGNITYVGAVGGTRQCRLVNGATFIAGASVTGTAGNDSPAVSFGLKCAAGDLLSLQAFQNSGAALNQIGTLFTNLTVNFISN